MRKSMKSLKTFEVVNKTDRPLARAIKKIIIMIIKKRNKLPISGMKGSGHRLYRYYEANRRYYEQLHSNKITQRKWTHFLKDTNSKEIDNLDSLISIKDIEFVAKNFSTVKLILHINSSRK